MLIEIRHETPADASAIEAVIISAFRSAPHSGNNEQTIVRSLREARQLTVTLVAVIKENASAEHDAVAGKVADPALVFPGVPPEYFQALSFGSSMPRGVVSYHAAFY